MGNQLKLEGAWTRRGRWGGAWRSPEALVCDCPTGDSGPLRKAEGKGCFNHCHTHPAPLIGVLEQKINLNHFLIKDAKLFCVSLPRPPAEVQDGEPGACPPSLCVGGYAEVPLP